jgi:hypothetical protein
VARRAAHPLRLRALGLLNAGAALFGATSICGLIGVLLVQALYVPFGAVGLFMAAAGTAAFAVMLAASGALFIEGACGRDMVRLHHRLGTPFARRHTPIPQTARDRMA